MQKVQKLRGINSKPFNSNRIDCFKVTETDFMWSLIDANQERIRMLEQGGSSRLIPRVLSKNIKGMQNSKMSRNTKKTRTIKGSNHQKEDLKEVKVNF